MGTIGERKADRRRPRGEVLDHHRTRFGAVAHPQLRAVDAVVADEQHPGPERNHPRAAGRRRPRSDRLDADGAGHGAIGLPQGGAATAAAGEEEQLPAGGRAGADRLRLDVLQRMGSTRRPVGDPELSVDELLIRSGEEHQPEIAQLTDRLEHSDPIGQPHRPRAGAVGHPQVSQAGELGRDLGESGEEHRPPTLPETSQAREAETSRAARNRGGPRGGAVARPQLTGVLGVVGGEHDRVAEIGEEQRRRVDLLGDLVDVLDQERLGVRGAGPTRYREATRQRRRVGWRNRGE